MANLANNYNEQTILQVQSIRQYENEMIWLYCIIKKKLFFDDFEVISDEAQLNWYTGTSTFKKKLTLTFLLQSFLEV